MKILLVAKQWRGGLGRYYYRTLNDMFPGQVEWLKTRPSTLAEHIIYRRSRKQWRDYLRQRITQGNHDVALFVEYQSAWSKLPADARNILYSIDGITMGRGDLDAFSRIYLSDPGYVTELQAVCMPEQYAGVVPFACYPPLHRPASGLTSSRDVVFIGNRDAKRDAFITSLLERDYRTTIYGNYFLDRDMFWRKPWAFRPAVSNDRMGEIYARHRLSINIHAAVVRAGTNMRSFECAAYGIPQVVEARPGIEDYFAPGEELLLFTNEAEMRAAIDSLLVSPEKAVALAARARTRALQEHTYCHRVVALLKHHLPDAVLEASFKKAMDLYAHS